MIPEKFKWIFIQILVVVWVAFGYSQPTSPDDTSKSNFSESQQIQLRTFVESSRVPQNRPVIFHVELSWLGNLSRYRIEPVSQPILTNLILEGSGSENRLQPLEEGNSKAIKAFTYRLKPLEMGMAYIDGILIKYMDTQTNEENSLSSQRVMVEIIEPIPENHTPGFKGIFYSGLLLTVLLILAFFVLRYFKQRNALKKSTLPQVSLAEIYLDKLTQEVDPRGTNLSDMISRLSSIFREYLDKEFNIHSRESSTAEIIRQLEEIDLDDLTRTNLSNVFQKIEVIKFSGKDIDPSDFTNIYGIIESFLHKRKQLQDPTQVEKKEES
jgi:hypothetical protein